MNMKRKTFKFFDKTIISHALIDAFVKLDPCLEIKNPVMFIVFAGAILTAITVAMQFIAGKFNGFNIQITIWLWLTVLFANFAEAIAEGRGKAQAESLRKMRTKTMARRLVNGREENIVAAELKVGDIVVCETGDTIPGDGEVIEGIASVDESAITGESAPVIRESGGDRSAVTSGTQVLSDKIIIRITSEAGNTFLDRMIAMVEGAKRRKTPNEMALSILLIALTIIFLAVVVSLLPFTIYSEKAAELPKSSPLTIPVLVSLFVCLAPTTIGSLLSAIGISGMDRLIQRNVLAVSGRAVEAAGDIDVLLLDKTGTITLGNRMATEFIPVANVSVERLADAAQLASLADETPEGRSIVVLAKERFGLRGRDINKLQARFIPFSAQTQMSGVDIPAVEGRTTQSIRKGSLQAIHKYLKENGAVEQASSMDMNIALMIGTDIAIEGGTPLLVIENLELLGIVQLNDVIKGGIKERFEQLRAMGIRTVMITGDNQFTAASIAAEAGMDDFIAQATPETKLQCIREEQSQGRLIAMIGDGTNDAPALAQADVGVAMNTGTQAAREAGNMVDLDSNPTKLIEIVEIGKQLLMTRGALTTFSIANDVAKYFAILPALFSTLYAIAGGISPLATLNIMKLTSPESAILSAVIFNALIIIALVPLALRGVKYRPLGANAILIRNLMVFGVGGLIAPFIGIKLIDWLIVTLNLV